MKEPGLGYIPFIIRRPESREVFSLDISTCEELIYCSLTTQLPIHPVPKEDFDVLVWIK